MKKGSKKHQKTIKDGSIQPGKSEDDVTVLYGSDLIANSIGLKTNDYYQINRFPSSERDISLIFDKSITSADVVSMIGSHKLVETVIPVDVYSGDEIQEEKKSVTYRIIYRAEDKTLTRDQVEKAQNSILDKLEDALGVMRRC